MRSDLFGPPACFQPVELQVTTLASLKSNKHAALLLLFAAVVGTLVVLQILRAPKATASPAPTSGGKITVAALAKLAQGPTEVTVFLTSNTFLSRIPDVATKLLNQSQGSVAARRAAQRDPFKRSDAEAVAASIAENSRNAALPAIRRAASIDSRQSNRLRRFIEAREGEVLSASPVPNQITAVVRMPLARELAAIEDVRQIAPSRTPIQMASPIDGSSTWWAGGFTGQGTSADGNGSPDAAVFDTGTRTTHLAFNSRLAGDCPTCDGSGPTRTISPTIRTDFSGSKHANTIAAAIAATDLGHTGGGGMAYGIDKLYDNYEANNPFLWDLGIASGGDPGLGGHADLPEVINYSAGAYQDTVDLNPGTLYWDSLEANFGILNTISAGNCGHQDVLISGCADGPHRVSTPGTNYNVFTLGGLDTSTAYPDTSGYFPWANTSPGPTWGGRKKPDVIAPTFGTAGTPSAIDDVTWTSSGNGTSFAAPIGAAGALLLASGGVYKPTAQKAIMINSTTPVQGQTYWKPKTGWGALNMSTAFAQRGNYADGSITGSGANSARFFKLTGVASGDRSTLVWNRRTTTAPTLSPTYFNLTNLDLSQFDPNTLASTATGGSDAADTVDVAGGDPDPVQAAANATPDNPMPGNGTDGGDNVEQVRSTGTGTQILKVKALTPVDGAAAEPFSIASANAPVPQQTPIPSVSSVTAPSVPSLGQNVTVTTTVQNPSADLALTGTSAQLTLPAGATLISGVNPQSLGAIAVNGTAVASWTIQVTTPGTKTLTAAATGTTFGETFNGTSSADVTPDSTPPALSVNPPPTWSTTTSPTFTWSATDGQTAVTGYDVETNLNNGAWNPLLTLTALTTTSITGTEGQELGLRVRAHDAAGNVSAWSEVHTTIDVVGPALEFGSPQTPNRGTTAVPVSYSNIGAPITAATYAFTRTASAPSKSLAEVTPSISNLGTSPITAVLTATVTDALGRSATKAQTYTVLPRFIAAALTVSKPVVKSRTATISGKLNSQATGKVAVLIKRSGKTGTRRVSKRVAIKNGKFRLAVKLKAGKYKATVSWRGNSVVAKSTSSRTLRVR